jgi:hypothetical protein
MNKKKLIIGSVAVVGVGTLAYFTRGYWMFWKKEDAVPPAQLQAVGLGAKLLGPLRRGGTPVPGGLASVKGTLSKRNFSASHLS